MLSDKQRELISQIACDEESGNHLLRPRSEEYWEMSRRLNRAFDTPDNLKSEDDKELMECYRSMFYNG